MVTTVEGVTFAEELSRAATLLRGPDYADMPADLRDAFASILDRESLACDWRRGGVPCADALRAARAIAVNAARQRLAAGT